MPAVEVGGGAGRAWARRRRHDLERHAACGHLRPRQHAGAAAVPPGAQAAVGRGSPRRRRGASDVCGRRRRRDSRAAGAPGSPRQRVQRRRRACAAVAGAGGTPGTCSAFRGGAWCRRHCSRDPLRPRRRSCSPAGGRTRSSPRWPAASCSAPRSTTAASAAATRTCRWRRSSAGCGRHSRGPQNGASSRQPVKTNAQQRVLVTGAAGFLGSNVVRSYVERGAAVRALVRTHLPTYRPGSRLSRSTSSSSAALPARSRDGTLVVHAAAVLHAARPPSGRSRSASTWMRTRGARRVAAVRGCRASCMSAARRLSRSPPRPDAPADETFGFNLQRFELPYNESKRRADEARPLSRLARPGDGGRQPGVHVRELARRLSGR